MFPESSRFLGPTLAFSDVVLVPKNRSILLPSDVSLKTQLTRRITGNIPFLSAAMDSVTEYEMAKALARAGGVGVIHRNLSIDEQAGQVEMVKRSQSGMIEDPRMVRPDMTLDEIEALMGQLHYSGFPVVDPVSGKLVGLVTNRDIRLQPGDKLVSQVMTPREKVQTGSPGTTREQAEDFFRATKLEKLPIVDLYDHPIALYTFSDVKNKAFYPLANTDDKGRLRVAGAVGSFGSDLEERAEALVVAGVDILVIDVKNGHHETAMQALKILRGLFPDVDIIPANVVTAEAALAQIELGADAVKVGYGVGSICTSTDVTGVGMPQFTATMDVAEAANKLGIPVITDGGLTSSADVVKALAAGASSVMSGRLFAGTIEAPGETLVDVSLKVYRGMGSPGAQAKRNMQRYLQTKVAEGVEGAVPLRGAVSGVVAGLVIGVQTGMSELGAATIGEMKSVSFRQYTSAGQTESHPHDIILLKKEFPGGVR